MAYLYSTNIVSETLKPVFISFFSFAGICSPVPIYTHPRLRAMWNQDALYLSHVPTKTGRIQSFILHHIILLPQPSPFQCFLYSRKVGITVSLIRLQVSPLSPFVPCSQENKFFFLVITDI